MASKIRLKNQKILQIHSVFSSIPLVIMFYQLKKKMPILSLTIPDLKMKRLG